MERYFSASQIADLLGVSERAVQKRSSGFENGRKRSKGKGYEWPLEGLPSDYQQRIIEKLGALPSQSSDDTIYIGELDEESTGDSVISADGAGNGFAGVSAVLDGERTGEAEGANRGTISPIGKKAEERPPKVAIQPDLSKRIAPVNSEKSERLAILADFDDFHRENPQLTLLEAHQAYATAYNAGDRPAVRGLKPSLSARTLHYWQCKLKKEGMAALKGDHRGRPGTKIGDENSPLGSLVLAIQARNPHYGSVKVYDELKRRAIEEGLAIPSEATVRRWLENWKAANPVKWSALVGPNNFNSRTRAKFGDAAAEAEYPNHIWEIDSTKTDLMIRIVAGTIGVSEADFEQQFAWFCKRYTMLNLVDVYTWRGVSLLAEKEDRYAVGRLLVKAMKKLGMPGMCDGKSMLQGMVRTDNGLVYTSEFVYGFLKSFPWIELDKCAVRSPWQKPFVERSFRTLQHDLFQELPGFVGHNVAQRQQIRDRKSRKKSTDQALTAEQLQERLDHWWDWYMERPHEGKHMEGLSPLQRLASSSYTMIKPPEDQVLAVLLAPLGERTIQPTGIEVNGHCYAGGDWAARIGQKVIIRQVDDDLGRILVFSQDREEFLFTAECPSLLGLSTKEVASKAHQIQRAEREAARALRRKGEALGEAPIKKGSNVVVFKPQVEAPVSGAVSAAQQAIQAIKGEKPIDPQFEAMAEEGAKTIAREQEMRRKPQPPSGDIDHWIRQRLHWIEEGVHIHPGEKPWLDNLLCEDSGGRAMCDSELDRLNNAGRLTEHQESLVGYLETMVKQRPKKALY